MAGYNKKHVLLKRVRNLTLSIDLHLYSFDHVILPVALYGCEILGFENGQIIENLHYNFFRQIIGLRKSTPIYICDMHNWDDKSIPGFWLSIVNDK